jgi:hypothetical protein
MALHARGTIFGPEGISGSSGTNLFVGRNLKGLPILIGEILREISSSEGASAAMRARTTD